MSTRLKMLYGVYIILVLFRNVSANTSEKTSTTTKLYKISDQISFCSAWLSAVIGNVCDNVYKIVKRDTSILIDKMAPKSVQEQKMKQRMLAKERWRRVRRQVATECCDRACTVGNLIMYCPENAKVILENPDLFEDE